MTYGITGNTNKEALWQPAAGLVRWLADNDLPFCLHTNVAQGLRDRHLIPAALCDHHSAEALAARADVILSFGGDGTLLRSAHDVGTLETPILGINIGRLGFLANVEAAHVNDAIRRLEQGDYAIDSRMVLSVDIEDGPRPAKHWALNDIVIERGGPAGLLAIDIRVDGTPLNRYWSDGVIISTPTGSTAYSLAVGGPIVVPGSDVIIISPIASHSLTVRPVVLPSTSVIEARVVDRRQPYVLAVDGVSTPPRDDSVTMTVRRAPHRIRLITFSNQHYFKTLRNKLAWGSGSPQDEPSGT